MKKYFVLIVASVTFLFSSASHMMTESRIQGRLNHVNGYSSECVMHKFYTDTGWIRIEGEVGRNGIDGLYYKEKNGLIREVLVAESKWNTSRLGRSGKDKLIRQMSQEWILRTMDRLKKYKPLPEYGTIKRFIEHDQYRARLFRVYPVGSESIQIDIYKIKNKGRNFFDTFVESKLEPINLNAPANSFERKMVAAHNECRKEALNHYFPMLSKSDIEGLLKDNYIQKGDISDLL